MRRPNAALVISIIALVGAWGGPALAAKLITSKDVQDRSLQGRDIAKSTITGRNVTGLTGGDIIPDSLEGSDIDERSLNLDRLADASIAGVTIQRFTYADPEGKSEIFYDRGGIRVAGFCNGGTLEATALAQGDNGIVRSVVDTPGQPPLVTADNDFEDGESFPLLPPGLNDVSGSLTFYQPNGDALIVQYLAASQLPPTGPQCLLAGVAIRTSG